MLNQEDGTKMQLKCGQHEYFSMRRTWKQSEEDNEEPQTEIWAHFDVKAGMGKYFSKEPNQDI